MFLDIVNNDEKGCADGVRDGKCFDLRVWCFWSRISKRLFLVPQVPKRWFSVLSVTHPKVDKFDTLY